MSGIDTLSKPKKINIYKNLLRKIRRLEWENLDTEKLINKFKLGRFQCKIKISYEKFWEVEIPTGKHRGDTLRAILIGILLNKEFEL